MHAFCTFNSNILSGWQYCSLNSQSGVMLSENSTLTPQPYTYNVWPFRKMCSFCRLLFFCFDDDYFFINLLCVYIDVVYIVQYTLVFFWVNEIILYIYYFLYQKITAKETLTYRNWRKLWIDIMFFIERQKLCFLLNMSFSMMWRTYRQSN
jgi:hypothetical protein